MCLIIFTICFNKIPEKYRTEILKKVKMKTKTKTKNETKNEI
jgi:hypothetical protein